MFLDVGMSNDILNVNEVGGLAKDQNSGCNGRQNAMQRLQQCVVV